MKKPLALSFQVGGFLCVYGLAVSLTPLTTGKLLAAYATQVRLSFSSQLPFA